MLAASAEAVGSNGCTATVLPSLIGTKRSEMSPSRVGAPACPPARPPPPVSAAMTPLRRQLRQRIGLRRAEAQAAQQQLGGHLAVGGLERRDRGVGQRRHDDRAVKQALGGRHGLQHRCLAAAARLAEHGDVARVAAKACDVVPDPLQRRTMSCKPRFELRAKRSTPMSARCRKPNAFSRCVNVTTTTSCFRASDSPS